jgi:hypothetical protein
MDATTMILLHSLRYPTQSEAAWRFEGGRENPIENVPDEILPHLVVEPNYRDETKRTTD